MHVQGGHDTGGEHSRAKAPGRAPGHAPGKDQLHPIGSAEIEILPDHFLEEATARERSVQYLGQCELRLQDREPIPVACGPMLGRKRMRQPPEPFAKHRLDLLLIERLRQPLHPSGVIAG